MPKRSLLIATSALLLAFVFASLRAGTGEPQRNGPAKSSQKAARPEALFRQHCSRCHGTDGRGQTTLGKLFNPPDFTDGGWWAKHSSTRELITIITQGKKHMPAFGRKLTRSQIASLAAYVHSFSKIK